MKRVVLLGAAVLATAVFSAGAEESPAATRSAVPAIGKGTDALLALQRDNRRPGKPLAIPAAEAAPAQNRYLETFKRPIPDQLRTQQGSYSDTK